MYHSFFVHSSVNGHLGCFHVLAIVNSVAVNNGIHVSFSTLVSSGYMPRSGIAGHMVILFLIFKGISIPPSILAVSIYTSSNSARPFPFLHTLSSIYICRIFDDGHSDQCEVISHCGFDLHFSNNERCWAPFHVFVSHLYVFFGELFKNIYLFLVEGYFGEGNGNPL